MRKKEEINGFVEKQFANAAASVSVPDPQDAARCLYYRYQCEREFRKLRGLHQLLHPDREMDWINCEAAASYYRWCVALDSE